IVSQSGKDAYLNAPEMQRIPEDPCSRLDEKPSSSQRQRRMILRGHLPILRRHLAVERDDVAMQPRRSAEEEQEMLRFDQRRIEAGRNIVRAQIAAGVDGRKLDAVQETGSRRDGGDLEIDAGRHMWFRRVTIFFQPAIDVGIVGMREAHAAVEKQRKTGIRPGLTKGRDGSSQQYRKQESPHFHPLKLKKFESSVCVINK